MNRSLNSVIGSTIGATDGEIGKVKEFYFDDKTWTIRYLVVETGSWFSGKSILLAPESLLKPDWDNQVFPTNLTMQQVKNSPEIDTDKPVSRQQEVELYGYYPWHNYWDGGLWAGGMGTSGMALQPTLPLNQEVHNDANADGKTNEIDLHLRSTDAIIGYHIKAKDGEIGELEDFLFNDQTWRVTFMEVDTGDWFPGKKVLLATKWINTIDWESSLVIVNVSKEQVENSPEYIPSQVLSDSYEANLLVYYGRYITHQ